MKQETLVAACEHVVNKFLVEACTQGNCCQRLSLATGEHGASVRAGNVVGLAPDGANLGGLAAIHADAFVENYAAHCIALHVVEVAVNHWSLLLALLLGNGLDKVLKYLVEAVVTPVLVGVAGLGDVVAGLIALLAHALLDFLVVNLVAILTLGNAELLGEFLLCKAHWFDCVVGKLQGCDKVFLLNLVHLTFDHHNIVVSSTYHQFHVSVF